VLPEHRGHGYGDDIVGEIIRVLVAGADARTIRADTDLANRPMAAAFERAGFREIGRRLVLSAPLPDRLRTSVWRFRCPDHGNAIRFD
jgi:RimJ/RimL family protein N-acetyltransferase